MSKRKIFAALAAAALLCCACTATPEPRIFEEQLPPEASRQDDSLLPDEPLPEDGGEAEEPAADGPFIASLPLGEGFEAATLLADRAAGLAQAQFIAAQQAGSIDLSIPQAFAITRPAKDLKTTYNAYYITGTSNPGVPVYFGDTEIQRQGTKGTFGVFVQLEMGANTFRFSQGGESQTVTITRLQETRSRITKITQSSMYPRYSGGVKAGSELLLECEAPSGATVTAAFDGQSAQLTQVAQAVDGLPVTFRGKLTVGTNYDPDAATNAGKISYTLHYGGASAAYASTGDVIVAGENSRLAVEVTDYLGIVYNDPAQPSSLRENLKTGARDYISSINNNYVGLASGGYVPAESVRVIEGAVSVKNELSGVEYSSTGRSETYIFKGTRLPVFYTDTGDGTSFKLTLYNTDGAPSVSASVSALFSGVSSSATDTGNGVTYTFAQKTQGNLWGYNVYYNGTDTILRFAYKPRLSGGSQTLDGITIVIDPGHGGNDPGALGMAGLSGPDENTVNFAHALALRDELEGRGATVILTREALDETKSLDERLQAFESSFADLFIALHHNSAGENVDTNKATGAEVYYHNPNSKNYAVKLMNGLSAGLGRQNRRVEQSYYRVTLLPSAPSLLCELGFMTNPADYERATSYAEIERVATTLADSIETVFQ